MNKHDIIKAHLKPDVDYTLQNRALCLLPGDRKPSHTAGTSLRGKIQDMLKQRGWLYYGLIRLFKPTWRSQSLNRKLKELLQQHSPKSVILNLGSGPRRIRKRPDIINVDLYAFDEVDMVADAADVPLVDASSDFILNQALLEHVPDPEAVVQEMYRLLRSGGKVFCYLPFIVPFHAAPHDYHRWTKSGVENLFQQFDGIDIGIGVGPVSGMLWIFQEWLALFLSFGSKRLHDILFLVFMVLTSPMKILDLAFERHPNADKIASGFFVVATKGTDSPSSR